MFGEYPWNPINLTIYWLVVYLHPFTQLPSLPRLWVFKCTIIIIHILYDSLNKSCNVLKKNQATQEKDHQVPSPSPYSWHLTFGKHRGNHRTTTGHMGLISANFTHGNATETYEKKHKPIQIHFEEVFEAVKHLLKKALGASKHRLTRYLEDFGCLE